MHRVRGDTWQGSRKPLIPKGAGNRAAMSWGTAFGRLPTQEAHRHLLGQHGQGDLEPFVSRASSAAQSVPAVSKPSREQRRERQMPHSRTEPPITQDARDASVRTKDWVCYCFLGSRPDAFAGQVRLEPRRGR